MKIIYPDIRMTMHAIINTRALPVIWYIDHTEPCLHCSGVFNPLCSFCQGTGQQRITYAYVVSGLVRPKEWFATQQTRYAVFIDGDVEVVVPYTGAGFAPLSGTAIYSGSFAVVAHAQRFAISGALFERTSHTVEGVPPNRITVIGKQIA